MTDDEALAELVAAVQRDYHPSPERLANQAAGRERIRERRDRLTTQPRERAVACQWCWPRTRCTTWNTSAVCDDCTRLTTLVDRPPRWSDLFGIDPNFTAAEMTEADTATAWARWCSQHTGGIE